MANTFDYLAVKLAPTIFEVKPAVLLTLKDCKREVASDLYTFYMYNKRHIARKLNVKIYELKNCGNCAKVMFYKENLLKEAVFNKWRKRYLTKYGYNDCQGLDEFLMVLKKRFNNENFPHEIGIFLGYPLKDVAGFLHCPEKCRKGIGRTPWKIFGNPLPSLRIIKSHREAVNQMLNILSEEVHSQLHSLFPVQSSNELTI